MSRAAALWSRACAFRTWLIQAPPHSEEYWLTRFVFLRLLGLVYTAAFLSLANQLLPLIGSHGLLPARLFLEEVNSNPSAAFLPSIFRLGASDGFLLASAWTGVALSLALLAGFANAILMAFLWILYLSFVSIGQEWYGFGWESQLLETGFLAIFLCPLLDARPFPRRPPPTAVIWLLRWLAFRIMLGAGLIKMRGDASWRDLTALATHYETQPIPNPLSRILHFMPLWFHKMGCLWNHFIELVVPFFAFWPARLRRIAGVLLISFQGLLILSGNLSFLNWLTLVPCIACLDDGLWRRILPKRLVAAAERAIVQTQPSKAQTVAAGVLAAGVALLSLSPIANLLSSSQVMNTSFEPFRLVNSYGAFGSVGKERYELVIEGTADPAMGPSTKWIPYEFKAKPGDVHRSLPVVSPYHYRLDWQIWFAAMSSPRRHPWMIHLVWKLLHNDRSVLGLLANDPFPDAPPQFIRVERYRYRFAPMGSGAVWIRERVGSWLPPLSKDDDALERFIRDQGW